MKSFFVAGDKLGFGARQITAVKGCSEKISAVCGQNLRVEREADDTTGFKAGRRRL